MSPSSEVYKAKLPPLADAFPGFAYIPLMQDSFGSFEPTNEIIDTFFSTFYCSGGNRLIYPWWGTHSEVLKYEMTVSSKIGDFDVHFETSEWVHHQGYIRLSYILWQMLSLVLLIYPWCRTLSEVLKPASEIIDTIFSRFHCSGENHLVLKTKWML